jgi:hypothetical protein
MNNRKAKAKAKAKANGSKFRGNFVKQGGTHSTLFKVVSKTLFLNILGAES